jgi:hypothetical protein
MRTFKTIFSSICLLALATPAVAQDAPVEDTGKTEPPTAEQDLPAAQSDNDPQPEVAAPIDALPPGGLVRQAGVGGVVGYGRAGVLELGGSAGLMLASGFRNMNISPTIGWFIADNLELSAIIGVTNIKAGDASATVFSALIEPSYHVPFNRTMFGFLGIGIGGSYVSDLGGGLAVAPRLGANFLVGRSGVLTPSLSYEYTTQDIDTDSTGAMTEVSLVQVSSALRVNIGYTVMW